MPVTVQFSTSFHKLIICYSKPMQKLVIADLMVGVNNPAVCEAKKSLDLGNPKKDANNWLHLIARNLFHFQPCYGVKLHYKFIQTDVLMSLNQNKL
ncbi:hypothetical protein T06_10982 [Trichinella sp. T6]|nr:hypothetical protein T06_10982 [Trichinella sp. T6]